MSYGQLWLAVRAKGADEPRALPRRMTDQRQGKEMALPFFALTISDRLADYSPFLMTVTAVALKEAFTSFPSVNDSSSKE